MTEPQRLEALIAAVNNLAVAQRATQETLARLVLEMREPPSSELPDLMRALISQTANMNIAVIAQTKQIEAQSATVAQMGARISTLRDSIVKATGG